MAQKHVLAATGAKAAASVGAPALAQKHALIAVGGGCGCYTGAPALAQKSALVAVGAAAPTTTALAQLAQKHALSALGAGAATTIGHPVLGTSTGRPGFGQVVELEGVLLLVSGHLEAVVPAPGEFLAQVPPELRLP